MREPAVIFDFGNVVGFFDYLKACQRLGPKVALRGEAFRQRIVDRGFPGLLARFESGKITSEEFANELMTLSGLSLPYDDLVKAWQDIFCLNEPVARIIAELKLAGYPLLLGSNTNVLHSTYYRSQFASTLDLFDHFILSHEVGHMKPGAPFYEACVAAAGLPASSCIFVDDLLENVEGAQRVGLIGLHYVNPTALINDLARLGIVITPNT